MDIQVGDRVTYKNSEGTIKGIIINDSYTLQNFDALFDINQIIKIERPKYEVVEEKKELLTGEEREFLKLYMKINDINASKIKINNFAINFINNNCFFTSYINTYKSFHSLVLNREYTLKELGLEGK